ncbi:helix-turn-helix domain-containing protein [Campylobacter ureolyticus]|uniref:helix-turn-helix domain-containing protein n=1 Tax=Campylobacter ureolyticus TaxID=827 RepID=UPI0022B55D53|nr:helix-turn-helix domain-containing protein [Campylobacter ureolyticus]MCZ6162911.1 helix-turn-helix domain-containing protein [Campylobacter ureolyticus]MCZ6164596.1 helix-turn-helix domain-containing protein [Campylobacter ureolyticus]
MEKLDDDIILVGESVINTDEMPNFKNNNLKKQVMNDYGICFNEWLFDERIKSELALLIYISSLSAKNGFCVATNKHFADKFKVSEATISRQISKLEKLNLISVIYDKIGSVITKRSISLVLIGYAQIEIWENYKKQINSIEQKDKQ